MRRVLQSWKKGLLAGMAVLVSVPVPAQSQQRDLSVSVAAPQSATVGVAAAFTVGIGGSEGATGVTVTAVFLPKVTLDSSVPAGLCSANTAITEPSTTVTCAASGLSSLAIRVVPQSPGLLTAVVGVIGGDYDPFMGNNKASAIVSVTLGATPTPAPTSTPTPTGTRTNTPTPTLTPGGPTATPSYTPTNTPTRTPTPTPAGPTPTPGSTYTLFGTRVPSVTQSESPKEIGELFKSSQPGAIVALRFWKSPNESGSHRVSLWNASGVALRSVDFGVAGGSGWQEATLEPPMSILQGEYYWVSYNVNASAGETPDALGGCFFGIGSIVNGPLATYCGGTGGPSQFPGAALNTTNYFADILFQPGASPSPTPTNSPTITNTFTATSTATPTWTPSKTATLTPTPTPPTPSNTPTRTNTYTPSPTATPNTSGMAVYSSVLGAPACSGIGSFCYSGALLNGRDNVAGAAGGPEPNQPNTLYGSPCPDGGSGAYHVDESIDAIRVSAQPAGATLAEGVTVNVDVTVWVAANAQDFLDLYFASDARAPIWTSLSTARANDPNAGTRHFFWSYVLPSGNLQAIRANFRRGGNASTCTPGGSEGDFNDHDDLVFAVGAPPPTPTRTSTVTGSPTQPSPTRTPTATITNTLTATAQPNPRSTPTATVTDAPMATATSTPTATRTNTPKATFTNTPTQPSP